MRIKVKMLKDVHLPYNMVYEKGSIQELNDWICRNDDKTRDDWKGDDRIVECYGQGLFSGAMIIGEHIELID